jgi:hypothetical protein
MDGTRYPASKEFTWSEIEVVRYLALPYRTVRLRALTGANLPIDRAIDTEMVCEVAWGVKSSGKASRRSVAFRTGGRRPLPILYSASVSWVNSQRQASGAC